jgi:hypothetical protein
LENTKVVWSMVATIGTTESATTVLSTSTSTSSSASASAALFGTITLGGGNTRGASGSGSRVLGRRARVNFLCLCTR